MRGSLPAVLCSISCFPPFTHPPMYASLLVDESRHVPIPLTPYVFLFFCVVGQVKVLEVSRNRDGEFSQVARAMTLSGVHTKGVHGVSFNPESTRVVTASIDGSWCVQSHRTLHVPSPTSSGIDYLVQVCILHLLFFFTDLVSVYFG